MLDAYEVHKAWVQGNLKWLFDMQYFPLSPPGGCTSVAQPLGASLNKPFKECVRDRQEEDDLGKWQSGQKVAYATSRDMLCHVSSAFAASKQKVDCSLAWKQNGISTNLDGSADHMLSSTVKRAWEKHNISEWRSQYPFSAFTKGDPYALQVAVA